MTKGVFCDTLFIYCAPDAEGVIGIGVKKVLRPYMRRLGAEAALRSVAAGGLVVLPLWLAMAAARRVFAMPLVAERYMPAVFAAVCALLYALRFRPTMKKAARRLDALVGQDRIKTMVEFAGEESAFCRLQREDAIARLAAVPPRALQLRVSAAALAACTLLAAATALVLLVPQEMIALTPQAQTQESAEAALLREKIGTLRAAIEESELQDEDRASLLAQVDALLDQLDAGSVELSALAGVRAMMEDMEKAVAELTPRDTYAAAMLEYESLRALGEAIFDGNIDVVNMVFDAMEHQLAQKEGMEQMNALMDLVYDINGSLAKPLRDNSQEILRQGMMMLAGGLETAAEMAYGKRDNSQILETAIGNAKEYVREFLGVPSDQERYDPYANKSWAPENARTVNLAPAASVSQEKEAYSPPEVEHIYDPPEAVRLSGYAPGETDENGNIQKILAPKDESLDGTVPYGEVYGAYYARYLEEISADSIPQELREAVSAYFDGI